MLCHFSDQVSSRGSFLAKIELRCDIYYKETVKELMSNFDYLKLKIVIEGTTENISIFVFHKPLSSLT